MTIPKLHSTRSDEKDFCKRASEQPLIDCSGIKPSDPRLKVFGVLNPTFVHVNGVRRLIVRVDERPIKLWHNLPSSVDNKRILRIAHVQVEEGCGIEIVEREVPSIYNPDKEPFLPEESRLPDGTSDRSQLLLSYISHLRFADFERDRIVVHEKPLLFPDSELSKFGCEDPRSTFLEGRSFVTYTAQSRYGSTSWLAELSSSGEIKEKRCLLGPDHKHSILFPNRIGEFYYMLIRPLTRIHIKESGVWLIRSPDLIHWGDPRPLVFPRPGIWDSDRVGPAAGPIATEYGWLFFYYGVDPDLSYQVGAVLLDTNNPAEVIARSSDPILCPVTEWERNGRRADTVFPCGVELNNELKSVRLYYGAADSCIGAADISLTEVLRVMSNTQ